jgi:hypothetical protein
VAVDGAVYDHKIPESFYREWLEGLPEPIRADMIKKKLVNNFQCQKFYTEEIGEGISRKVFDSLIDELAPGTWLFLQS